MPDLGGGYAMNPQQAQMKATQAAQQPQTDRKPEYPPDHVPAMRVPKGGSSCSSCEYLGQDGGSCTSQYFVSWNGSNKLPAPADEFCSDWYEPKDEQEPADAGGGDSGGITDASMSASPQVS